MKELPFEKFNSIPELTNINELDNFMSKKEINHFLSGEKMIGQKSNKKIGDIVTIYKVVKTDKNKIMYIPDYFKLV